MEAFKIAKPTPNAEYDCKCEIPFIMSAYTAEIMERLGPVFQLPITQGSEVLPGGCVLNAGIPGVDDDHDMQEGQQEAAPMTHLAGTKDHFIYTILSYRTPIIIINNIPISSALTQEELERDVMVKRFLKLEEGLVAVVNRPFQHTLTNLLLLLQDVIQQLRRKRQR